MPMIMKGLNSVNVENGNYVRADRDMEVQIKDVVKMANGKLYKVLGFSDIGFARLERVYQ